MPKRKKAKRGPAELLVIEADEFPSAVIVELWHKNAKGKREFLDSRRFEAIEDPAPELVAVGDEDH